MTPAAAEEDVGLVLHVPVGPFAATDWYFRGANLCAWEEGLVPPLREYEVVVDPVHGRVLFGLTDQVTEGVLRHLQWARWSEDSEEEPATADWGV